ncbi:L-fucose:H+ symporter permease [Methylophaga pinxianii]|uniref:L-fucose:H+ symporter permease n=1 Tax=Methylophaga pinxianii TaxID=2881052 RepID=UPI001CF3F425|nr:L-fucose:H+ symporter permease [Methylophaga pinxianii]MCB2426329.1 L-fucose:H+ symporter permease [Methylophaga pinxianii]UPH46826.1 L-fucose:H+ symporter permease [Methylophaga pinxianii]
MSAKQPFVYPEMRVVFVLLITCFAAWGVAANMTDPLVKVFSKIFAMSNLQAALVQFAYYGAYFCLAIPAAFINRRYSYKTGVLCGLGLAVVGALAFYPASLAMDYHYFLAALFILAAGLSILETSANPFVMAMGPLENATRRLNLAQAFNPVGTNLGVFLAATLILPNLHIAEAADRALMTVEELQLVQSAELKAVMLPYVSMALALLIIWLMILFSKVPQPREAVASSISELNFAQIFKRLMANTHYRYGVIAQFFNVAAQVCVWTFTIQYVQQILGGTAADASIYLQYSLLVFLVSRFAMTWLMGYVRPTVLMTLLALTGSGLCVFAMFSTTIFGVWAVVLISACLSLMFPTIYSVALKGLAEDTKFGAAGLVMAILGGAIMPLFQGALIDVSNTALSYSVPAVCFLVVAAYAYFDVRSKRAC